MYTNSKLVPRADRISDSVLQTGHPFLLFPLPLVYICRKQFCFRTIQRLAKRKTVPKQIRFSSLIFNRISKCPSAAAEIEVKSVLFAFCFTSAPLNAGTPPRGTFTGAADRRLQVWSAVRTNQPPVSDELTLLCQLILKRFFFCTVSGTLFLARQKENVGDIPRGKAAFLAATAIFYKIKISRPLFAPQYQ